MKIQEQDQYHGPALMQIVEHPAFTALTKADGKYGHYLIKTGGTGQQWLSVEAPEGRQMRVTGSCSNGEPFLVPHNKFPKCIF